MQTIKSQKAGERTQSEMDVRDALYTTSEDISSALLWLTSSMASASERIAGATACLRKAQSKRAKFNSETDNIRKESI